jgi:putative endopeptidase
LTPGYGWRSYFKALELDGKIDYVIVSQPSYLGAFNKILAETALAEWCAYFRWQLLATFAPYLSQPFVAENCAFYGTAFPAAILQPPFFDPHADDAVNYGSIGAVIGHEISHGFDDQGSQFDAQGNLRDGFTQEDHDRFAAKTAALVAQYSAYEPVLGYHINRELTWGENIADNSGLAVAYRAHRLSLGGRTAPVIDGLAGDQRFYMGWAQAWQAKVRENTGILRIKADPHAAARFRAQGTVVNQPAFYGAFAVKPGDRMYLPPQSRVIIR